MEEESTGSHGVRNPWLLFIVLMIFFRFFRDCVTLSTTVFSWFSQGFSDVSSNGFISDELLVMLLSLLSILLSVYTLILLFTYRKRFKPWFGLYQVLYLMLDYFYYYTFADLSFETISSYGDEIKIHLLIAIAIIVYVSSSKRIEQTFVRT